jgi:hypothetical protein
MKYCLHVNISEVSGQLHAPMGSQQSLSKNMVGTCNISEKISNISVEIDAGVFSLLFIIFRHCILPLFSVEDYKHRGPGFDYRALLRIFLRE